MYRIVSVLCCCYFLLLSISCASSAAQGITVSPVTDLSGGSEQEYSKRSSQTEGLGNKITETSSETQTAVRLLSELTQAVENHDVHKGLALFSTIYESCNGQEADASLIDARNRIKPLLESISIEVINKPAPTNAGSPFTQPFTARIVITIPGKQFPLDNYPITVLYPSAGTGSSLKKELVRTDSDGFLYFTPPTPNRACDGKLLFCLYPVRADTALINDADDNLSVFFPYKVATTEKRIPSIIAILDYDENNAPIFSSNTTSTRLLMGLMKRGFTRVGLDEYRELANADDTSVIRAAQAKIGAAVDRFIFGRTYITVNTEDNIMFTCTIRADVSIWDFKQARKINRFTFTHTAKAKTKTQAISLARADLGEAVIAETFNYSL